MTLPPIISPKTYTVEPDKFEGTYLVAKSAIDGSYIGLPDFAQKLEETGIAPQAIPGKEVSSIGFSESEQKWYGWSHRAICSFGIGSKVTKGDCAYVPVGWDDFMDDAVRFWSDDSHLDVTGARGVDREGREVVNVSWTYASDSKLIPNKKIHGTISGSTMYPPKEWGRGEWEAKTLDDAKKMAVDFAESVA